MRLKLRFLGKATWSRIKHSIPAGLNRTQFYMSRILTFDGLMPGRITSPLSCQFPLPPLKASHTLFLALKQAPLPPLTPSPPRTEPRISGLWVNISFTANFEHASVRVRTCTCIPCANMLVWLLASLGCHPRVAANQHYQYIDSC